MSNYPDSFRINSVGELPCNNKQINVNSNKPIIIENNNLIENDTINKFYNSPNNVTQDNTVSEESKSTHSWSNQRSYGNIVVATHDTCNNVHGRIHPFNRLHALSEPYIGPAVKKDAWNMNKVKVVRDNRK